MFESGRPNTGYMLGYKLVDGKLEIIPDEADIVLQIFSDYLSGMGLNAIMKKLNDAGVVPKRGGRWSESTIYGILHNEKYTGDMLLQKTYRQDYITKKKLINRGQLPMYHVENSHEPIIDLETFEAAQCEIARRSKKYYPKPRIKKQHLLTGLIRCGICGKNYHRKTANAGSKYAKPVWICPTFNTYGKSTCPSQQIPEHILLKKTAEALGVTEIDETNFGQQISEIQVPTPNHLIFLFKDGHAEITNWQNPSRSESWSPEMKQAARARQKAIIEKRRKK